MNLLNMIKARIAISPALVDDSAFTANVFDKQDYDGAKGFIFIIATGALDIALSALKLQESDTKTDGTTLGGTPADVHDVTAKPAADDDDELVLLYVPDAAIAERFFQLQATAGNGTTGVNLCVIMLADMVGIIEPTADSHGVEALEIAS